MNTLKSLPTKLDYYSGENEVPEGTIRISASGIGNFFTYTRDWWGQTMLNEEGFKGNTASVTGTIVHYILQRFAENQAISDKDKQEIQNYITKYTNPEYSDYNPDIDINYVEAQYKAMAQCVVNDYLVNNMPTHVEPFVTHEVISGSGIYIYVGGSIDNLTLENPKYKGEPSFDNLISTAGGCIVDYKTSGVFHTSLPKPSDQMKFGYKLQLLTYAWVLRQKNITIDRIRLVYVSKEELNRYGKVNAKTGRASKLTDYPAKTSVQTVQITEEDFEYIEGIIRLVAESIKYWQDHPEARHLLAHDYRLKEI